MNEIKLDMKDRRLLDALDSNSNSSLSSIAKKVKLSKQVVDYRIRKLIDQGTIYSFFSLIDPGRLGYSMFRVHIKLKNVSREGYDLFAKNLFRNYSTFWVGFVSGSFDVIVDIFSRNSNEFDSLFNKILKKNKKFIQSYEIFPLTELNMYSYGYFLDSKLKKRVSTLFKVNSVKKIDKTSVRILKNIKSNSRLSYEEMGRKVRLTRNSVKNRIKKLEKLNIINGYQMMVNFRHMKKLSYKILIKYDHSKIDQEKDLIEFIADQKFVLAHTKLLGRWNLDIEIQPGDAKDLQKFIINIRNKFGLIGDYELIQIIEDYGIDFFPDRLMIDKT